MLNLITPKCIFLEPQFQNVLGEAPGPPVKGGPPPSHGPDKTTARLFVVIVRRLLKVVLPLLQIFGRTLLLHSLCKLLNIALKSLLS